jgi:hypothetical protein
MPRPVKALLDANVLYANHLRNLLLQLAQNDLFDAPDGFLMTCSIPTPCWSKRREAVGNLTRTMPSRDLFSTASGGQQF